MKIWLVVLWKHRYFPCRSHSWSVCLCVCLYVCVHMKVNHLYWWLDALIVCLHIAALFPYSISRVSCGLFTIPPSWFHDLHFIHLFIYPAGFVALIPWAGGYFHLMNALYFSFVREVAKLFSSKLSHWRWWFSWGEQTQTTLWLFIILAGSRGSKPKANDTTRRKISLCHIYASFLMSIFSLFRNACAFKDAETRRMLPKREFMALGTLWPLL